MTIVKLFLSMVPICHRPLHQLDIINAFFHGDLEREIYMEQPTGIVTQGESGLVYKLCHSLYHLKQSPHAWFKKFNNIVQSLTPST